jgi:exodeoxyribonuclease-3
LKIATWNVNSIRARQDAVLDWLGRNEPDVLCMQETKVVDDDFPTDEFLRLGYAIATAGQKTYNGVAIATRLPMSDVTIGLTGERDPVDQRAIAVTVGDTRIYSVYVPNGKSPVLPSFKEKLAWFARLAETVAVVSKSYEALAICGDYNVAPGDGDVYDPDALRGQLHFHPDEHRALENLVALGLVDVFRLHHPEEKKFSWWDYRAGSFRRNLGLRIDLILATKSLADRCVDADIDVEPRRGEKPSDHTPVIATFR